VPEVFAIVGATLAGGGAAYLVLPVDAYTWKERGYRRRENVGCLWRDDSDREINCNAKEVERMKT
jgi:hypothetical protein